MPLLPGFRHNRSDPIFLPPTKSCSFSFCVFGSLRFSLILVLPLEAAAPPHPSRCIRTSWKQLSLSALQRGMPPSLLGEALLICRGSRLSERDWDTTPGNMAAKTEAVSVLSTNGLSITPARSSSPIRALIAQQDSANCGRGTAESLGVLSRGCPRCHSTSRTQDL